MSDSDSIVKSRREHWLKDASAALCREMPGVIEYAKKVTLPDGEQSGSFYNPEAHPGQICALRAMEDGASWVAIAKPVQDGGSLASFIPILRRVTQEAQTAMIAYPTREKAADAWKNKLWPILAAQGGSLPRSGSGSRGGIGSTTHLPSGGKVMLRAAGGRHEAGQAADSADILLCDELDDWENLRRIRLIERRVSRSQCPLLIYVSTVKRDGLEGENASRILALWRSGSATRIEYPCVNCACSFVFEWEQVNIETRTLTCPHCAHAITDTERLAMLPSWRRKDGCLTSDKFSIMWSALDSPFSILVNGRKLPVIDGLIEEYNEALKYAARNDFGFMRQFFRDRLTRPFIEPESDGEISNKSLAERASHSLTTKRIVPAWVKYLTIAQDPGKFVHYWLVQGHGEGGRWCVVDWGYERVVEYIDNKPKREPTDTDHIDVLNLIRDKANGGWQIEGSDRHMKPVQRGVDIGFEMKLIVGWLAGEPDWKAMRGLGDRRCDESYSLRPENDRANFDLAEEITRTNSLKVFRPDGWRQYVYGLIGDSIRHNVHAGLLRQPNDAGSGVIPVGLKANDMLILHLCGEVWKPTEIKDGKQIQGYWAHSHGGWDLLDCLRYSHALGMLHTYHPDMYDSGDPIPEVMPEPEPAGQWLGDNTRWKL